MWMSDKPLNQQRLARDLADLCNVLNGKENFLGFVRAFWKTMAREWGGIDALRMDKFLYLVRCYVGKGFECVGKRNWDDEELVDAYLEILEDVPMNVTDARIPNGLRYHVIDVYVDELDKMDTDRTAPLEKLLVPLRKLGQESLTKAVRLRVQEALENERLKDWKAVQPDAAMESNEDDDVNEDHSRARTIPNESRVEDKDDEFSGFGD